MASRAGTTTDTIFCWTNDNKYKVVLVGDSGVGKTSIFWQYIEEYFPDDVSELKVTMVDFKIKNMIVDNELIKMYIWDTAGQERYRALISNYFKGTHGILLVFDLGKAASFESIKQSWYNLCREKSPEANFILVGNKADLAARNVSEESIHAFTSKHNLAYFEVSAFSGINVNETFERMANDIKQKFFPKETPKDLGDQSDSHLRDSLVAAKNTAAGTAETIEGEKQSAKGSQETKQQRTSVEQNGKDKIQKGNKKEARQSVVLTAGNNSKQKKEKEKGCC